MTFNFLPKYVSNFSHYKKHSASWYRKYKLVWCKALAIVIIHQLNINIQVKVSKNPQRLRDKLFIADGQTERGMFMMSLTHAFRNLETPLQKWHWSPDSFLPNVQNTTVPCPSQELLPFLSVMYYLPAHFSISYSSILPQLIWTIFDWQRNFLILFFL